MQPDTILELKNVTKYYPGTTAVDNVSLSIQRGEIHGLVGENGAGKSTLIKILSGAVTPSAGQITFEGSTFERHTPLEAIQRGIGVIYQEFNLVPSMTIAENIFLGREHRQGIFVNYRQAEQETHKLLREWNIDLDPKTLVSQLSIAQQQIVEIIKAISHDVHLLIMDEPTASLTLDEVHTLFRLARQLAARNVTIIYISHRLEEIFDLCERVTVMRDGKIVKTATVADINKQELIRLMVGREIGYYPPKASPQPEVVLSVRNLSDGDIFADVSFDLHRGEILGMYALIGAGRTDVAMTLFGAKPRRAGDVRLNGQPLRVASSADAVGSGLGLIPEDRKGKGLILSMRSCDNMSLSALQIISVRSFINMAREKSLVERFRDKLKMQAHVPREESRNLSGGTQQKVVIARLLARNADVLLFDEPTRGIDVGAKHEIYELMVQLCQEGKSILMISSEMPELLGMSDRILVMREGRVVGEVPRGEATEEKLLSMAAKTQQAAPVA
ncbi:MAG: sugar ABC transporter ATP-binding protein [Anaerolineae bacterium]|nr:sugar ABC transporter ATP-binding protein [Anaerolineae bacterium]